tara:strand:+ start:865 stop:1305 length:441 start_codon:yes stop_codon:yes gene_type:complete
LLIISRDPWRHRGGNGRVLTELVDARGDSATIRAAASAVGYRPVFSWANSLSSLVDLAAQGTIGVKSGFSETLDAQLGKIWGNTASALKSAALANRPKNKEDKDAALSDDDWLEAHPGEFSIFGFSGRLYPHVLYSLIHFPCAGFG